MLPPSWASFHPMHAQSMSRGSNSLIEAPSSQICQVDKQEWHHSQLRGKTSIHFSLTDVRESHRCQAYAQQSPSISGTVHKFSTENFLPSPSLFNSVIFIYLIICKLKLYLLFENSMHAYNIFWSYPPSSLPLNSLILLHPHPSKLHSFLYIYSSERLTCTAHILSLDCWQSTAVWATYQESFLPTSTNQQQKYFYLGKRPYEPFSRACWTLD